MTGAAGAEELAGRGGRHHHFDPIVSWCSYHQVTFKTPTDRRLAGGRSGPDRNEDPDHEATRGVGPVTGSMGLERRSGRGGRHPASSTRGPLGAHTIERPSPLLPSRGRPCRSQDGDRVPAGLPEGTRVSTRRRFCRGRVGRPSRDRLAGCGSSESAKASAGAGSPESPRASAGGDAGSRNTPGSAGGGKGTRTATKFHTAGQPEASTR